MAIVRDASSPAKVSSGNSAAQTTASFTPPANAWVYVSIGQDTDGGPVSYTITNSGSGLSSWTQVALSDGTIPPTTAVYRAFVNSSVATTVTVTSSGVVGGGDYCFWTDVWTGADSSQTGAATSHSTSTTQTNNPTLTTTRAGSQVCAVVVDYNNFGAFTSSDTIQSNGSGGAEEARIYKASNSGAAGSVAINIVAGAAGPTLDWQLYEILAPSASGTAVNPGVGALALATFAPTIAQPHAVSPGVTALTLAGFAPTVSQPHAVTPGVGALTLATFAPNIAQPHGVAPGAAALALATFAPTVAQAATGLNLTPDPVSLVLGTSAPTIAQTANQGLTPGVGALTLTGFAPAVSQPQGVSPGVAAMSLATFAPSIAQPQGVSPGAAALTLTGYAPVVQVSAPSQNILPDAGGLVLTTYAPKIEQRSPAVFYGDVDIPEKKKSPPKKIKNERAEIRAAIEKAFDDLEPKSVQEVVAKAEQAKPVELFTAQDKVALQETLQALRAIQQEDEDEEALLLLL